MFVGARRRMWNVDGVRGRTCLLALQILTCAKMIFLALVGASEHWQPLSSKQPLSR